MEKTANDLAEAMMKGWTDTKRLQYPVRVEKYGGAKRLVRKAMKCIYRPILELQGKKITPAE